MSRLFVNVVTSLNGRRTKRRMIHKAIRELENYSDRDLDDLGLLRSEIFQRVTQAKKEQAADAK